MALKDAQLYSLIVSGLLIMSNNKLSIWFIRERWPQRVKVFHLARMNFP